MDVDTPAEGTPLSAVTAARWFAVPRTTVWALWTTRDGLEAWWCPEGFTFAVQALDVRPGGPIEFRYKEAGTARNSPSPGSGPGFGPSFSWTAKGRFSEVDPPNRLAFRQVLVFGTASSPQEYRMTAVLHDEGVGTRLEARAESPTSKHWSLLARGNLAGQMDRLEAVLNGSSV